MSLWPCDESNGPWQKLDGCKACIKIEEVQRIDFRKPRWGQQYHEITTVSRLCLRKFEPSLSDTCFQRYGKFKRTLVFRVILTIGITFL
ncbi:hypothetical protein Smp_031250 [Schistosoma mansoni]|uniref:hypothetical protein n=1 Tax=Schistosoma mansoni TaxID=6183 RepID=UPI00022DC7A8|nr:hypothetical protein Smp_031250 [Schistosoma mansoni]|eukprot:XP_018653921.1 hypothetical protein Smp_031250 [Schistosoma mansoni]